MVTQTLTQGIKLRTIKMAPQNCARLLYRVWEKSGR